MPTYTLGIDYGTESGRAVLVDTADGREVATAVHRYSHGVIDEHLPGSDKPLPPEWALQDPMDYIAVLQNAVPAVLRESGVSPTEIVGVGIDFTACTMLPTKADGTPLCTLELFRQHPHAWVKLWKHHASQPQADQINQTARRMGEGWLNRYGGKISSEWFFSKALQILQEAPEIYDAADRLIEATDWVIWQMTGVETRNACTAGYKAIVQDGQYPSEVYFAALDRRFADVVETKTSRHLARLGDAAGVLTAQAAAWMGLQPGIAVAVANVDAHVTVPAVGVTKPGTMVMIMGTSTCHMVMGETLQEVEGMCGVVQDGIVPGLYGYEAGQSGVGDIFAWFVENGATPVDHAMAQRERMDIHAYLEREAARQKPGEHGLLALDWVNGNRSTLVDADLTGMIVGMTLATKTHEMYRAWIEATAYGTRTIIEAFEGRGVPIHSIVAAGGLPERNKLLMQIYADVTGREFKLAGSAQAPALGAAMHAAVAARVYPDIGAAAVKMAKIKDETIRPIAANQTVYNQLYADYKALYNYFGRGHNDVMKRLKKIRNQARGV
ncbi:MAG: ribulokinase [Chloroflexota bacterium]|nr:ribulokinase [Chloroflexota bacterium]